MDFKPLLQNKNIARLSFALFLLLALFLASGSVPLFIIGLLMLAAAATYLLLDVAKKEALSENLLGLKDAELSPVYAPITSTLRLSDVAGLDDAKEELFEIRDFLKHPAKYRTFNARIPKGVLLVGPPGVGKTMIAKALAGEADVPFYYQSGSSFVEIYVGMGAKKVHELFKAATKNAPSIIFIDEIDSVGKARGANRNDEREATLNQLLTEMDGFDANLGVVVIAATNRMEVLDDALLRAGRFDRHVHLFLPSITDRESILLNYLKATPNSADIKKLALMTSGFSGASLENLVNEAALHAIRKTKKQIETDDFLAVKDKVQYGRKQQMILSESEKETIALYQSAKAVTAKALGLEFEKITLFENSFLSKSSDLESGETALNKIAAQIGGILAYDTLLGTRYSNIDEDIAAAKNAVEAYCRHFNLENNLAYAGVLEKAKDIAAKTLKSHQDAVLTLKKALLQSETVHTDAIRI
jgi:ATP-dependent metalloprotease FtsH